MNLIKLFIVIFGTLLAIYVGLVVLFVNSVISIYFQLTSAVPDPWIIAWGIIKIMISPYVGFFIFGTFIGVSSKLD